MLFAGIIVDTREVNKTGEPIKWNFRQDRRVMAKRKQPKELKVNTVFTPVQDWDARLKRVMSLLLHYSINKPDGRKSRK